MGGHYPDLMCFIKLIVFLSQILLDHNIAHCPQEGSLHVSGKPQPAVQYTVQLWKGGL